MNDELFDTQSKKDEAINNFKSLLDHPGWQLIIKIIEANIEVVRNQIINGADNETVETINRLRDKLKTHEEVKNMPQKLIKGLTDTTPEEIKFDPYPRVGDKELDKQNFGS